MEREIPVSGEVFDRRAASLFGSAIESSDDASSTRDEILELVRELVDTRLTERQRQIVDLYYTFGRTQAEIAAELGISQQVVSRQLFGVLRNGRRVGGALKRLRTLCDEHGVDPDQWV